MTGDSMTGGNVSQETRDNMVNDSTSVKHVKRYRQVSDNSM